MSIGAVDALARGRVHSGDAAQRVGLVDRLGGLGSAIIRARALAQLGPEAGIQVRPPRRNRLIDFVLGGSKSVSAEDAAQSRTSDTIHLAPQLRSLLRVVATLEQLGEGEPLALMPFELAL